MPAEVGSIGSSTASWYVRTNRLTAAILALIIGSATGQEVRRNAEIAAPTGPSTRRSAQDEVELHRGLLQFERGQFAEARDTFKSLERDLGGDPDVGALLALSERELAAERKRQDRRLTADIGVGYQYVSDLIILGRPVGLEGQDTSFHGPTLDLQLEYTWFRSDMVRANVHTTDFFTGIVYEGDPLTSVSDGLGDFEHIASYQGGVEVEFLLSDHDRVTAGYDVQYVTIPFGWGANQQALTTAFHHAETALGATSLFYQLASANYSEVLLFEQDIDDDGEIDALYSSGGLVHLFGVTQRIELPRLVAEMEHSPEVEVGVSYERDFADESEFQSDNYTISAVLRTPIPNTDLELDIGGWFRYSEFDKAQNAGPNGAYKHRLDHEAGFRGGVTKTLSENVAVRIEGEYFRHTSNEFDSVDPYEYDSYTIGLRLQYTY